MNGIFFKAQYLNADLIINELRYMYVINVYIYNQKTKSGEGDNHQLLFIVIRQIHRQF